MTYKQFFNEYYGGPYADVNATEQRVLASMTQAERIAWKLLEDVTDRRSWGQAWDSFDDDIQDEIFAKFVKIIGVELGA